MASRTNRVVSYRIAYFMPSGNCLLISAMAAYTPLATAMALAPGQGEDDDLRRLETRESRVVAEALLAQVHPGDVAQPDDLRRGAGRAPDDDVLELSVTSDSRPSVLTVNWKTWSFGTGGPPSWPAATCAFWLWMAFWTSPRQPEGIELLRVEPDAHAVGAGAEDLHLADAGQAGERVLQVDDRVVAEEDSSKRSSSENRLSISRMFVLTLRTFTPCACTGGGSCDSALLAAFWTSDSEVSRSVPTRR